MLVSLSCLHCPRRTQRGAKSGGELMTVTRRRRQPAAQTSWRAPAAGKTQLGDVVLSGTWLARLVGWIFFVRRRCIWSELALDHLRKAGGGRGEGQWLQWVPAFHLRPVTLVCSPALVVCAFVSSVAAWKSVRIILNFNNSLYNVYRPPHFWKFGSTVIVSLRFYCNIQTLCLGHSTNSCRDSFSLLARGTAIS